MNSPAYQADARPVERDAFYAIACDPRRSVVVEACAGAGKTWMLVSRIVRALLDGAQPNEILAITFTRKAAGEMRERLTEWLRGFASPTMDDAARARELVARGVAPAQAAELAPVLAQLHERVLAGGRPVEIRTFHAWFSQLLRAAPLELLAELGLQPGLTLLEEIDDHRGEIFRRFHAALLGDAALRERYAGLIGRRGRSQVRKWLEAALDKRIELELADAAGVLEGSVPAVSADGESPARDILGVRWQETLRELALELGRGKVTAQKAATGLGFALASAEQGDAESAIQLARDALFTQKDEPRKIGGVEALAGVQDELAALVRRVRQHEAHVEHRTLVDLSRVLLKSYATYKRTRALADMADLEMCALRLLRDSDLSAWVQERLDTRIRHVLIDEFQDTSPLQWQALHSWLSAYAGAGGGASGQRPPGVFIVGDPKQSIYRFRRAEPRVFEAAREFVCEGLAGHWLACDHTRRNAPQVIDALNTVFTRAEAQGEFGGFRSHTTEVAVDAAPHAGVAALPGVERPPRERAAAGEGDEELVWRDTLTTPRHEPETLLREEEARRVASAIQALVLSGQVRPGEVMVLSRKRESLRLAEHALHALHLPCASVEKLLLMDAPEVRDLVAVLDVLVSTSHRLSLAHALRSPLFGASDEDLLALARLAAGDDDWWRALIDNPHPDHPTLQRACGLLSSWHAAACRLPPHDLLDRIVAEGELHARLAAAVPAEQRVTALASVDALMSQALMLDGARYATPYSFVRALKRRTIQVAAPDAADAVRLLTVHGAKGLEAKAVFVMDAKPEPTRSDTATLLVEWPVEAEHPSRCAFLYSEANCPPALEAAMDQERAARRREELNGLYVAMTRAREHLVFSLTEPHGKSAHASWWERVEEVTTPWPVEMSTVVAQAPTGFELSILPRGHVPPPTRRVEAGPRVTADSLSSRLGQAVHRVLEWAASRGARADVVTLARAAASEFGVGADEVARIASAILTSPACARFFDTPNLLWAGNEVAVAEGGDVLRIDRLVAVEAPPDRREWWVLDYKLAWQPQSSELYREQMKRYREAVRLLQPDDVVRCALIGGSGEFIEID